MRFGRSTLPALACLFLLNACGGKKGSVTCELRRVEGTTRSTRAVGASSSLTIASLKVPIREVALTASASGGGGALVYQCAAGTNDGCLVDLAAAGALENLLTTATATEIQPQTYTFAQISTCRDEGSYTGKIKASGKTDPSGAGPTLYTQAASGELTTDVTLWAETSVYFSGCSKTFPLPVPVTVVLGDPITMKLYFDIRDIAFFGSAASGEAYRTGGNSLNATATPTVNYVGVNYLDVAGTVDSGNPTIERFRVTTSTGEIGTIGLISTSAGVYFGGFTRSYFSADTTQGSNRFVTPLQTFTSNGGDTFTVANYGSSTTGRGYFNAATFVKATSTTARPFTDQDGASAGTYTILAID